MISLSRSLALLKLQPEGIASEALLKSLVVSFLMLSLSRYSLLNDLPESLLI